MATCRWGGIGGWASAAGYQQQQNWAQGTGQTGQWTWGNTVYPSGQSWDRSWGEQAVASGSPPASTTQYDYREGAGGAPATTGSGSQQAALDNPAPKGKLNLVGYGVQKGQKGDQGKSGKGGSNAKGGKKGNFVPFFGKGARKSKKGK